MANPLLFEIPGDLKKEKPPQGVPWVALVQAASLMGGDLSSAFFRSR